MEKVKKYSKQLPVAAVELFWYREVARSATPDRFLGVYHHLVDHLIYKDLAAQYGQCLEFLKKGNVPVGFLELKRLQLVAREELRALGVQNEEDERKILEITAATKKHLEMPKASLQLFGAIQTRTATFSLTWRNR